MAAPPEITVKDLSGKYVMNKSLSDPSDAILSLQGVSWFNRKAIGIATVTLHVNVLPPDSPGTTVPGITQIKIIQVLTGGIRGTTELRTLDFQERSHTDHVFGKVAGRSHYIGSLDALDRDVLTRTHEGAQDATDLKFLRGDVLVDGTTGTAFLPPSSSADEKEKGFIHSFVKNEEAQWTAEQVWGFEELAGKRYYTRRVVVRKLDRDQVVRARFVYDYMGRVEISE